MSTKNQRLPQPRVPAYQPGHLFHHHFPFPRTTGERSPAAKVTDAGVEEIRRRRAAGEDPGALASEFGICRSYVLEICRRAARVAVATSTIQQKG